MISDQENQPSNLHQVSVFPKIKIEHYLKQNEKKNVKSKNTKTIQLSQIFGYIGQYIN